MKDIAAYTPICEEDAWLIPQYLAEMERLEMPFAVHFDRCSILTRSTMAGHRLCIGYTANDDIALEFSEIHRQGVLDIVARQGIRWAISVDMDETFERNAADKFLAYLQWDEPFAGYRLCSATLWGDSRHLRQNLGGYQDKMYDVRNYTWKFLSGVTNGPRAVRAVPSKGNTWGYHDALDDVAFDYLPIRVLHWGMMTRDLRQFHKQRWDRIYAAPTTGGGNPYGTWNHALDEEHYPAVVVENPYL